MESRCRLLTVLLWVACSQAASADDRLLLVRQGRAEATIVYGRSDVFAAERLQRWFAETAGAKLSAIAADDWREAQPGTVILIGSAGSNRVLARLAQAAGLDVGEAQLTDQGYLAKRLTHDGRPWIVLAGGGPAGTLYAATDLLNWTLEHRGREVWLDALDTRQVPRFRYRWFWNWDHRMDWGGPGKVGAAMGGGGTYSKQPEAFLIDCRRCLDFMADHKFNGLILWGFLRDTHGGVPASQEVCRYATQRSVRILPGVGTSGYAGYYFEGRHPFNADTWLAAHPELRAVGKDGRPRNAPCPSKQENQDWLDRGAAWLWQNFAVGGVNLEMGDFFVCYCADCRQARAAIDSREADYYKDMALSHRVTLTTMRRLAPEAWLSYATYTGYTAEMAQAPPKFLSMIPADALCQWTLTSMARNWSAEVRPQARHNVGYLHWCNSSTKTEHNYYLAEVQRICQQAAATGFEGLDTYGELPDTQPNAELFYLAWEAFLWQPDLPLEQFIDRRLGRLYGGPRPARALVELLPLIATRPQRESVENCTRALALAQAASASAEPEGHARWERLLAEIEGYVRDARSQAEQQRQQQAAVRQGTLVRVAALTASDEDRSKGWTAARAIDGSVAEPAGYWLTRKTRPPQAWLELSLDQPTAINRVCLFHQLNPAHYRSLDYAIRVRSDGKWSTVADIRDNQRAGWVAHDFRALTADAVRLEITRSAHGDRMGVGEIELRRVEQ